MINASPCGMLPLVRSGAEFSGETKRKNLGKLQHKFEAHSAQVLDVDWKHGKKFIYIFIHLSGLDQADTTGVTSSLHVRQIAQLLYVL